MLILFLFSSVTFSQDIGALPSKTLESIEQAITTEMARQGIPGLSAAIVSDHQLVWSNGYGFSDLENFVPGGELNLELR